ncbi:holo-ACP synthase [Anaerotalea alkaliphila]|uniref:Holo-[acyl-carrier-protein] synthase n=1 Tax=Anaerotalea alkaliphila TaxID=2662126 RepID=A0A7X5HVT6_9FIRM|nr:holo-ACP synthase [Anaerotalea alkaliphila]NDL67575.1 holo-[acyl-carrier-protein] synthase [Anaerotalea alkaliphila]
MIIGIGTDLVEVDRMEKAASRKNFMESYFTARERELFGRRNWKIQTIAGNFAVKEAVSKALGTGIGNVRLVDVEVLRDSLGKPVVHLHGYAKSHAQALGVDRIHASISHTGQQAMAFVVAEGGGM